MPFNLPPPWDPGYALPQNVRDEGLERRAFVTKQMPRGTYDAPNVGSGGYEIPQYVRDEDYGQGAYTTKWQPRGTYNGPRIPQWIQRQPTVVKQRSISRTGAAVTFQRAPLSDDELSTLDQEPPLPDLYEDYGKRAAASILTTVRKFAPGDRKAKLKTLLDRIDPSLYKRAGDIAKRYVQHGLTAGEAFSRGLARALAAGIAAEVVTAGKTRTAPQPNSLLGLGCYGCNAALGATSPFALATAAGQGATIGQPVNAAASAHRKQLQVGDFVFDNYTVSDKPLILNMRNAATIPAAWRSVIAKAITGPKVSQLGGIKLIAGMMNIFSAPKNPFYQTLGIPAGTKVLGSALQTYEATSGKWSDGADDAIPIATFKHPESGHKWGVFVAMLPTRLAPTRMQVYVKWLPDKPWYTDALNWIADLPAKIVNLVEEAVDKLGELACSLAQNPNAIAAGSAAGMAAGGPGAGAAIGASGAAIAQQMCGGPKYPVMPLPPPPSNLLPLAIVGGGVLAAILLLRKKKTP